MTTVLTDNAHYAAIASAIRNKAGVATTYTPAQMAAAIAAIPTGGGGGGGVEAPTFLENSQASDILVREFYSDYDPTVPAWGELTVDGIPGKEYYGAATSASSGFDYQLSESNHSVTAYAIVVSRPSASGDFGAVSVPYGNSNGNAPSIYTRSSYSTWSTSVYGGSDTNTGIPSTSEYSMLTLAIDATSKVAHYYINGTELTQKSFSNSGSVVRFNGLASTLANRNNFFYLFVGVVDGCEDSTTILANQQDMLDWLDAAIIGTETEGGGGSTPVNYVPAINFTPNGNANTARNGGIRFSVASSITVVGFRVWPRSSDDVTAHIQLFNGSEDIATATLSNPSVDQWNIIMLDEPVVLSEGDYLTWYYNGGNALKYRGNTQSSEFITVGNAYYSTSSSDTRPSTSEASAAYGVDLIVAYAASEVAFIRATYAQGDIVTCSQGSTTLSSDDSGNFVFALPTTGTWTVSDGTSSVSVTADEGYGYAVDLTSVTP